MKLSFVPRRNCVPKWPGKGAGTYPYIGRKFDAATRQNIADDQPAKVEADTDPRKLSPEARRLVFDFCKRDGDLLPFDAVTAAFCDVPFRAVERGDDGEWDFAPEKPPTAAETPNAKASK
jgi:hypothetical protein